MPKPGPRNLITDVPGVSVGNAEDARVRTGTTVLLPDAPAIAALDVRGGAPGTRESDALDPSRLLQGRVDALVLSGGSVYGLEAAGGVAAWLGAQGRGFGLAGGVVAPIVPGAILFDLANGGDKAWGEEPPYRALGRQAGLAASRDFALGNAGAGFGAVAGSLKGGLGSASLVTDDGITIGALAAVNAAGSVIMPGTDRFWAALFEIESEFGGRGVAPAMGRSLSALAETKLADLEEPGDRRNTTIAIIATDAGFDAYDMQRFAVMAQDGFAHAIRPSHTPVDGDLVYALTTGRVEMAAERKRIDLFQLGAYAADCLARAVARGVYAAESLGGIASYRDRFGG